MHLWTDSDVAYVNWITVCVSQSASTVAIERASAAQMPGTICWSTHPATYLVLLDRAGKRVSGWRSRGLASWLLPNPSLPQDGRSALSGVGQRREANQATVGGPALVWPFLIMLDYESLAAIREHVVRRYRG